MIGIDVLVSTRSEGVVNIKRKRKREGEERKKGGGKEGRKGFNYSIFKI